MSIERRFEMPPGERLRQRPEGEESEEKRLLYFERPPMEKPDPEAIKRRRKRLLVNGIKAHIDIGHAVGLLDAAEQVRRTIGLNPEEVALVDDVVVEVQQLLPRLTFPALKRLDSSQPREADTYNLRAARSILKLAGFSDAELTEENMKQVVDYHRLLLTLKRQLETP